MLKRLEMYSNTFGTDMIESNTGDYVRYDDIIALFEIVDALEKELAEARYIHQKALAEWDRITTRIVAENYRYREALERIVKKDYHSITNNTHGMFGWIAKQALDREEGGDE